MAAKRLEILRDPARLRALTSTGLLDSPPEEAFDALASVVRSFLGVPTAIITLVDDRRQFFKSAVGLPEPWASRRQTPLSHSLCKYVVASGASLRLDDTREEPEYRDNPAVCELGVAAYAGVPLRDPVSDQVLGTVAAIDEHPRHWSDDDLALLASVAGAARQAIREQIDQDASPLELWADYRALMDDLPVGVVVHRDGRILFANLAAACIAGVADAADLIDRSLFEFVRPEDAPLIEERIREVQEEKQHHDLTAYSVRRPDGEMLTVEAMAAPVVFQGTAAVQLTLRDVSEQRQAIEALRRRDEELNLLLEQVPTILWTIDRKLEFTTSVGAGLEALGLAPNAAVGQSLFEFFQSDDPDFLPIAMHRRALEGASPAYDLDLGERSYRTRLRPLYDSDGSIIGVIGAAFDQTEQRRAEREYRQLIEQAPVAVFVHSEDRLLYANSAAIRLAGAPSLERLLEYPIWHFVPEEFRELTRKNLEAIKRDKQTLDVEKLRLRRIDGSTRYIELKAIPVWFEGEEAILNLARDVTSELLAKRALEESENRYRRIFEDSRDAIYVTELDGTMVAMNPAGLRRFGFTDTELHNLNALDFYADPQDRAAFQTVVSEEGSVDDFPVRLVTKAGEILDCEITATVRRNHKGDVVGYQGIIRDVTERRRFEEQLQRRALHDSLTELPNRTLFWDRVEQAIARAEREGGQAAVLFIDLDRFKVVNDGLGHMAGDQVLAQVARRLQSCVRQPDTVARVGGDEFTVLLPELSGEAEALAAAERIAEAMELDFSVNGHPVHLGVSIGIAMMGEGDSKSRLRLSEQADHLVRNADFAMYRAKERPGSNFAVFDLSRDATGGVRLERERELREALRSDQLTVFYQPIVSLTTGRIGGVESLVRWRHPERGLILPAEFLPLAEETGLILELDARVLEVGCRQLALWSKLLANDRRLVLHPNLSASQFENPELLVELTGVIERSGIDPGLIELEVTEHVVTQAPERTRGLKQMGFGIAVDDFGRGYSSLLYLRRLAIDALKIDQGFTQGVGRNREDEAIVRTIIALGDSLGLETVAEGIETAEQLAWLRTTSCGWAQGHYFARPVPAEEISDLLRRDPRW